MIRIYLLILLGLLAGAARAQDLEVHVRGSSGRAYQVAVQRFQPDPQSGSEVGPFHKELGAALESSSGFELVPIKAFLEPEQTLDLGAPMMPCDNWRGPGADILVEGRIELKGAQRRVRYRIWDIGRWPNTSPVTKNEAPICAMNSFAFSNM